MGLIAYLPDQDKRESPITIREQKPEDVKLSEQEERVVKKPEIVPIRTEAVTPILPIPAIKPEGMSEDDYKAALNIFTPERINELYSGFDPTAAEPFYQQLFSSVRKKPDVPDEKRIAASRSLGGLADALSLIIQGVAASQDSFIDLRNPNESASAKVDQNIQRLRDAYRKDRDAYDLGLLGATQKDIEGAKGSFNADRSALLNYLARNRDNGLRDKKFQGEMVYRYEKLKEDEAERKGREALNRAKLDLARQKANPLSGSTPRGYMDFYDKNTGVTYRVPEKKWKANYTQIFGEIKNELYKQYPLLQTDEKFGTLKPADKEEYVKQYMYSNPDAMKFLDDIAETKFRDTSPANSQSSISSSPGTPKIKPEELKAMQDIVDVAKKERKEERQTLVDIGKYLRNQGYTREQVESIINAIRQ